MKNIYLYLGLFILVASCSQESNLETNLQQSEIFLLSNSTKDGVISIEDGLQYFVIESGDINASPPELSDTITAHFHGTLTGWNSILELSREGRASDYSALSINTRVSKSYL